MQRIRNPLVALLLLSFACLASAAEWVVDPAGGADYTTIGAAVAAASPGDIITLNPGTYSGTNNYNITVNKRLTIRSAQRMARFCPQSSSWSGVRPV